MALAHGSSNGWGVRKLRKIIEREKECECWCVWGEKKKGGGRAKLELRAP